MLCISVFIICSVFGLCVPFVKDPSSEAQQKIIIKHYHEKGQAKVIIRTRDNRRSMVEKQFGICLDFFSEDSYICRCTHLLKGQVKLFH